MKIVKIYNTTHSWILKVEDLRISFQGYDAALYFQKHYKSLGYNVIVNEEEEDG